MALDSLTHSQRSTQNRPGATYCTMRTFQQVISRHTLFNLLLHLALSNYTPLTKKVQGAQLLFFSLLFCCSKENEPRWSQKECKQREWDQYQHSILIDWPRVNLPPKGITQRQQNSNNNAAWLQALISTSGLTLEQSNGLQGCYWRDLRWILALLRY